VKIDDHFQTSVKGIYAIGDVVRGAMLAHKGEDEGVAVAELIAGKAGHVNYDAIPNVIYTYPEVASVGKTEEELKQAGVAYKVGKFPVHRERPRQGEQNHRRLRENPRRRQDRQGARRAYRRAGCRDDDHRSTIAMEFSGSAEDIARTCHPHPTLSEAVKEAALAVDKRAIHM
jgi:dihydrolipoamide dehydrogenase